MIFKEMKVDPPKFIITIYLVWLTYDKQFKRNKAFLKQD